MAIEAQRVPVLSNWREAEPHLAMLARTIESDVRPLLGTEGFAPFAICREVFSYLDHLGHLYTGYTGQGKVQGRSREYLANVMAKVDPRYRKQASALYQMYRCGPVHEFQPKPLEDNRGRLLSWICFIGDRTGHREKIGEHQFVLDHLVPLDSGDGRTFWLPVSTRCLIDDLVSSVEHFRALPDEDVRVTAWNRAARELNQPYPHEFTLRS